MVLSSLLSNLSNLGVISIDQSLRTKFESEGDEATFLLKRSAAAVTDAILSNGTQGINMPAAVAYWRSWRHLTAITVAIATKLG